MDKITAMTNGFAQATSTKLMLNEEVLDTYVTWEGFDGIEEERNALLKTANRLDEEMLRRCALASTNVAEWPCEHFKQVCIEVQTRRDFLLEVTDTTAT